MRPLTDSARGQKDSHMNGNGHRSLWKDMLLIVATMVLTAITTLAINGVNSVSRADVEALIEKGEAKHEAKMDLLLDRLNKIEVNQARLEEKVTIALASRAR